MSRRDKAWWEGFVAGMVSTMLFGILAIAFVLRFFG